MQVLPVQLQVHALQAVRSRGIHVSSGIVAV